jgi:hypothetical protein
MYQLSAFDDFPGKEAGSVLAKCMDIVVRFTALRSNDRDTDGLIGSVDAFIVAFDKFAPDAAENRPKIHRLVHIPVSFGTFGNADEYNGAMYEHLTASTRESATSGNWKSAGLLFMG